MFNSFAREIGNFVGDKATKDAARPALSMPFAVASIGGAAAAAHAGTDFLSSFDMSGLGFNL